jgi:hypothetical protein
MYINVSITLLLPCNAFTHFFFCSYINFMTTEYILLNDVGNDDSTMICFEKIFLTILRSKGFYFLGFYFQRA